MNDLTDPETWLAWQECQRYQSSHRSLPAKRGYVFIEVSRVPDWLPLPDLRAVVVPVGPRAKEYAWTTRRIFGNQR